MIFSKWTRSALLALAVVFVFVAFPASAQTHYCDQAAITSNTVTVGTLPVKACLPSTDAPTIWKIYIDGAGGAAITMTTDGTVSTGGQKAYAGTVQVLLGTHTYQLTAGNAAGESAKSAPPFTLTANPVLTVPSSPDKVRVG